MKRNIKTTIEFKKGFIAINVFEYVYSNYVEIYYAEDNISRANSFLKESLNNIKNIIGGNIEEVFVVVEPSAKISYLTNLVQKRIEIANNVSDKDIDNLIELTKKENIKEGYTITNIQPLQFEVEDVLKKQYAQAPIHKKGNYISGTFVINYISNVAYEFIKSIVESHNVKINDIFTTVQTISQSHLSRGAIKEGSVLMNIDDENSFLSINKNMGTVDSLLLESLGTKKLISCISQNFNIEQDDAKRILKIYGKIGNSSKQVIYTKREGISLLQYHDDELELIVKEHLLKIFKETKKYIVEKKINNLPIILSGELTRIDGLLEFAKQILGENISIYTSLEYLELNNKNHNMIGVIKLNNILEEVLGIKLDSIVKTNPNTFNSLNEQKPETIKNRFIKLLGGMYERRN